MSDQGTPRPDPSPEEMLQEMARRLAATPVRDIMVQTMGTFADLAGVRLGFGPERDVHRDLPQARLAIEALRALIGVVETELGPAQARPFREPLAQLQLLYAREAEADANREAGDAAAAQAAGDEAASDLWTPGDDAGGDGSGRIWTPGD